jgi:hypothetical protein
LSIDSENKFIKNLRNYNRRDSKSKEERMDIAIKNIIKNNMPVGNGSVPS